MYLFKLTSIKMTVLFNVIVASVFLTQADLCGSHRSYCTFEVMRGRSKTIPVFTFDTHRGGKALLTFPCTEEY